MTHKPTDSLIELKPCPFCGESVDYVYRGDYDKKSRPAEYDIQCKTKGCYLEFGAGWYGLREDIANKWNTRLSPPVIEGELEEKYQSAMNLLTMMEIESPDSEDFSEPKDTLIALHDELVRVKRILDSKV